MAHLILPKDLLERDDENMCWKLSLEFVEWCDENFKEPYSFAFVRTAPSIGHNPFTRYQSDCHMLLVGDDDAALTMLRHAGVIPGDPDEEVEENKADRALFR
jgi:hypothetical protein